MASLGHIAVGMAAARVQRAQAGWSWRGTLGWSALAMLPDADVIGFALGVRYADPWGHRGAAHSLVIALLVAGLVTAIAPTFGWPRRRTWWIATVVVASHGLLDTLTDGGLGCALLWPFSRTRYFAPWRPIPVSPIGLGFLSPYGFFVAMTELALFAPLLVYAFGRPRLNAAFISMWLMAVWLLTSQDPVRERLLGIALREDTRFAERYSEAAFRSVTVGQPADEVRRRIGEPLGQAWMYFAPDERPDLSALPPCPSVYIVADRVAVEPRLAGRVVELCDRAGIRVGMARTDVTKTLGEPVGMCWEYSRSASVSYYRARMVCFEHGKVLDVMRRWMR